MLAERAGLAGRTRWAVQLVVRSLRRGHLSPAVQPAGPRPAGLRIRARVPDRRDFDARHFDLYHESSVAVRGSGIGKTCA